MFFKAVSILYIRNKLCVFYHIHHSLNEILSFKWESCVKPSLHFSLAAILCGKINYKACSSDPLRILTLSQKQFSLGGYQEEVKGLPIKQTYITEKGQKTGKHSNMGPSQSCSFSFTHGRLPKVSDVFGYLSFWKPLEKHLPVHVIIIDPTVIHIVERYVVCTYIQVKTFSFGKASLPLPVQASCVSCQHHLHRE